MQETLEGLPPAGLERSCRPADSIRFGPRTPGFERAEVFLGRRAFEIHGHDTYAIGITTSGVQTFRYRGERRFCLPGQLHVLHPDELHDGAAATDGGFGYRIVYVAPPLIREALGGGGLPFVRDPVTEAGPATRVIASILAELDEPLSELALAASLAQVADALVALSERRRENPRRIDARAVEAARDYLAAHARESPSASALEQVTGLDRFTLARQFRLAFGTSPDRYRRLRRLELARAAIERGDALARVAADAGFADQSHLTRQFRRAYGMTPARWAAFAGVRRARR